MKFEACCFQNFILCSDQVFKVRLYLTIMLTKRVSFLVIEVFLMPFNKLGYNLSSIM